MGRNTHTSCPLVPPPGLYGCKVANSESITDLFSRSPRQHGLRPVQETDALSLPSTGSGSAPSSTPKLCRSSLIVLPFHLRHKNRGCTPPLHSDYTAAASSTGSGSAPSFCTNTSSLFAQGAWATECGLRQAQATLVSRH
ncbi:MAG: hypothetical protein AAGF95_11265 [Chloroflexota bacterium]